MQDGFLNFCIFAYLKAIHNKDYSVVKTFKAASTGRFFCSNKREVFQVCLSEQAQKYFIKIGIYKWFFMV